MAYTIITDSIAFQRGSCTDPTLSNDICELLADPPLSNDLKDQNRYTHFNEIHYGNCILYGGSIINPVEMCVHVLILTVPLLNVRKSLRTLHISSRPQSHFPQKS